MPDQAHRQNNHPQHKQLAEALADNRQRIVTRVLTRCGYHIAPAPPADNSAGEMQELSGKHSFASTEAGLLRSGRLRWRGSWLRRRCHRGCPSPWSLQYWRGLLRRQPTARDKG